MAASPRPPSACARAGCRPEGLSFVAAPAGRLIGTVRLWNVAAGPGRPALLLGPLAVDGRLPPIAASAATLMRACARRRRAARPQAVLLVGDAPYYGRFGFSAEKTGALWLPGPYERDRLLALRARARRARRRARADQRHRPQRAPKPDLAALVAGQPRQ